MKYAVMSTWKHKNPIDWNDMAQYAIMAVGRGPVGGSVQWWAIDEYHHGSLAIFSSQEDFETFKEERDQLRKESLDEKDIKMIYESVGPIRVEETNVGCHHGH